MLRIDQKGITPIFLVLAVIVVLGIGGFWFYKSKQGNEQPLTNNSLNSSTIQLPTTTPIASGLTTPTSSPSSNITTALTASKKPTPTHSPTPVPKPEVSMTVTKDGPQYHFFASWKNIPNPTNGDWLGIYPYGEKGDTPISGKIYTASCADRGQTNPSDAGPAMGSCPMYTKLDKGTYEVRLYSNDTNQRIATSGQFTAP